MIYVNVSWSLLKYIIYFFGIAKSHWHDWILDFDTLEFDEDNSEIKLMRYLFYIIVFICTIPMFLKKDL